MYDFFSHFPPCKCTWEVCKDVLSYLLFIILKKFLKRPQTKKMNIMTGSGIYTPWCNESESMGRTEIKVQSSQ